MSKNNFIIILILVLGFILRLLPISFPLFAGDEVSIAARGYALTRYGTDELGRRYPYIFNSSEDYQLPIVSYLTAAGVFVFGKTDLGVRIPFILLGTLLIFSVYKLSRNFSQDEKFSLYVILITCFSPGLIFFSKFPNEFIVAAFLLTILLSLLLSKKINHLLALLTVSFMLISSKIFWFTLSPVILFTLLFNKRENRLFIWIPTIILNVFIVILFIKIPQGFRSLVENNFSTINDITIKNGIERLRSQVLPFWSIFLDRILISKLHFFVAAFFNWLSHFQLGILFGQTDKYGGYGFLNSGVFPKAAIIPFFTGLFKIIQDKRNKFLYLFIYIFLLTLPLFFVYPSLKIGYIILVIPLIVLIISKGFDDLNSKISHIVVFFIILEVLINYFFISSSIKNSSSVRPVWIKQLVNDIYNSSLENNVYVSDNSINIVPFIEWYAPIEIKHSYNNINFPYKFYDGEISNIKTISENNVFVKCTSGEKISIFATKRDMEKLSLDEKVILLKIYKKDSGESLLYSIRTSICIK